MAEVTFIGNQGLYKLELDNDLTRYLEAGYLKEWIPGVYEFTESGLRYFAAFMGEA